MLHKKIEIAFAIDFFNSVCYYLHMKLKDYLQTYETNADLARKLGVAPSLVSQWKNGTRPVPTERMTDIEIATSGAVTRKDLSDDWVRIWPELARLEQLEGK